MHITGHSNGFAEFAQSRHSHVFFEMWLFRDDYCGVFRQFWATCCHPGLASVDTLVFEIGFKQRQCAIPQIVEAEWNPNLQTEKSKLRIPLLRVK